MTKFICSRQVDHFKPVLKGADILCGGVIIFIYGKLIRYLQVGGVSDETVKYGREFCGTSTQE
jgi:hypothetical protein